MLNYQDGIFENSMNCLIKRMIYHQHVDSDFE